MAVDGQRLNVGTAAGAGRSINSSSDRDADDAMSVSSSGRLPPDASTSGRLTPGAVEFSDAADMAQAAPSIAALCELLVPLERFLRLAPVHLFTSFFDRLIELQEHARAGDGAGNGAAAALAESATAFKENEEKEGAASDGEQPNGRLMGLFFDYEDDWEDAEGKDSLSGKIP